MLETIFSVVGSILGGGATGLLGVAFQRFADYKNKQLDMQLEKQRGELELQKKDKDLLIMQGEWQGRLKVAEEEGTTAKDVADTQAFAATLWKEPERYTEASKLTAGQTWIMVLLDGFRGIVRPGLTIYLCVLTTAIYVQARGLLAGEDINAEQALEIEHQIISTILYLTTTVVLWWFGTRNKQEAPGK